MPKKRNDMTEGAFDNLTVKARQGRLQWEQFAREEFSAWLMMHGMRASRACDAARAMKDADPRGSHDGAINHWSGFMEVIGTLLARMGERWDSGDWRTAVNSVEHLESVRGEVLNGD